MAIAEKSPRGEIPADLRDHSVPPLQLLNCWGLDFYRVTVAHSSDFCFPPNPDHQCDGLIIAPFARNRHGFVQRFCSSCKREVSVDLTAIKLELGKLKPGII